MGAIGTLVASQLRQTLQPSTKFPISLLIQRTGIPDLPRTNPKSIPPSTVSGRSSDLLKTKTIAKKVLLEVKRENTVSSSSDFDVEIVGKALFKAVEHIQKVRNYALSSTSQNKFDHARKTFLSNPYIKLEEPIECLVVTLKCHHTLTAIKQLQHRIRKESVIVLLQNGMGVYDELCREIWPDKANRPDFVLGSLSHGVTREKDSRETKIDAKARRERNILEIRRVIHHGVGELKLGVIPDPRDQVDYDSRLFTSSSIRSEISGDLLFAGIPKSPTPPLPSLSSTRNLIDSSPKPLEQILPILLSTHGLNPSLLPIPMMQHQLLLKLCINCVINPITTILDIPNGELINPEHPQQQFINTWVRRLIKECSTLILKHLTTLSGGDLPVDIQSLFSPKSIESRVRGVAQQTASNTSSMLSDLHAGNLTEIDYINGYMIDLGQRVGIEARWNKVMKRLVYRKMTERLKLKKLELGLELTEKERQEIRARKKAIKKFENGGRTQGTEKDLTEEAPVSAHEQ